GAQREDRERGQVDLPGERVVARSSAKHAGDEITPREGVCGGPAGVQREDRALLVAESAEGAGLRAERVERRAPAAAYAGGVAAGGREAHRCPRGVQLVALLPARGAEAT